MQNNIYSARGAKNIFFKFSIRCVWFVLIYFASKTFTVIIGSGQQTWVKVTTISIGLALIIQSFTQDGRRANQDICGMGLKSTVSCCGVNGTLDGMIFHAIRKDTLYAKKIQLNIRKRFKEKTEWNQIKFIFTQRWHLFIFFHHF